MKSEERRAIIWLGYFAVAVGLRLWLETPNSVFPNGEIPYVNFFCYSPCLHLTVYLKGTLDILIAFWFAYTICILLYFSEDRFYKYGLRGFQFRAWCRRLANFFMLSYPFLAGTVIFVSALSFLLPDWAQSPYWLLALYAVGRVVVWTTEVVTGQEKSLKQLVELEASGARTGAELVILGLIPLLGRRLLRNKSPPRLRGWWAKFREGYGRAKERSQRKRQMTSGQHLGV